MSFDYWEDEWRAEELARERALERAAAGVAQVDRAVKAAKRAELTGHAHVPARLADALGWPRCLECDGGIPPGYRVAWRGGFRHVECALSELLTAAPLDVTEALRAAA